MSDRLDEIEARERAACVLRKRMFAAEPDTDAACDALKAYLRDMHASALDVPWLVAQVRERGAEIARLTAERDEALRDQRMTQLLLIKSGARTERERQRAVRLEAEVARLRALLTQVGDAAESTDA